MPEPRTAARHSLVLLLGCIGVLVVSGGLFLAALALLLGGEAPTPPWLIGARVGLVEILGPIEDAHDTVLQLEAMERDPSVRSVVVRVDSPGGGVAPSQEIHRAVERVRARKPVVASFGSLAASGGYYAVAAADTIVANPGSLTGSIGVILSFPTVVELMDKVGVRYWTYASGARKDIGSFAREPDVEDEAVLDALVGDAYEQFLAAVMEGRGMTREQLLPLADGRVFSGRQAWDAGLVDVLGDQRDAVSIAGRLGGIGGEPAVVRKGRPRIPLLDFIERLIEGGAHLQGGPRLEYRLR